MPWNGLKWLEIAGISPGLCRVGPNFLMSQLLLIILWHFLLYILFYLSLIALIGSRMASVSNYKYSFAVWSLILSFAPKKGFWKRKHWKCDHLPSWPNFPLWPFPCASYWVSGDGMAGLYHGITSQCESGEGLWLQGEAASQAHSSRDAESHPVIPLNKKKTTWNIS